MGMVSYPPLPCCGKESVTLTKGGYVRCCDRKWIPRWTEDGYIWVRASEKVSVR